MGQAILKLQLRLVQLFKALLFITLIIHSKMDLGQIRTFFVEKKYCTCYRKVIKITSTFFGNG